MTSFCLTIAGSDPSSGAGIQADIRTFEKCGAYGFSAITAITFQSAKEVRGYHSISGYLEAQLSPILEAYPVRHVKIGMIPDKVSLKAISKYIEEYNLNAVLDPVTIASTGDRLSEFGLETQIVKELFPKVKVITPNLQETLNITNKSADINKSYSLSEVKQLSVDLLMMLYPQKAFIDIEKAVVIKSAYEDGNNIYDVACFTKLNQQRELDVEHMFFSKRKVDIKENVHGTGCVFSSAITAYMSKNLSLSESIRLAEDFFDHAFQTVLTLPGGGHVLDVSNLKGKEEILLQIKAIYRHLSQNPDFSILIPEVRMNISGAMLNAQSKEEVAGFDGRITIINGYPIASGEIKFGASNHTARLLLTAKHYDPTIKFVCNVKYRPEWIKRLQSQSKLLLHEVMRGEQPESIKSKEHSTMQWIIERSYTEHNKIPDIIWDKGEYGKEPMIRVFGRTHTEMIEKLDTILNCVKSESGS